MLKDQKDLLRAFNAHGVEYLVIGGHAVGYHSEPRGTKGLDVWVRSNTANSLAIYAALKEFGAPLGGVHPSDFDGHPETVFQLGVPPSRVDVLQQIPGIAFDDAWSRRVERNVDGEVKAYVISREDLIANKTAAGRFIDLADVEKLHQAQEDEH